MSDKLPAAPKNQNIDQANHSIPAKIDIDLAEPVVDLDLNHVASQDSTGQDSTEEDDFYESLLPSETEDPLKAEVAMAMFEVTLQQVRKRELERQASSSLWLSHHWPQDYGEKCVKIGRRQICRRCAALYPLGFLTALLSVAGIPLWPNSLDPAMIWMLCIPATIAFVGEAIGLFKYSRRWQVATMLIAALAFGKALGYELNDRWSPEFWWPIAIFGGTWFLASVFSAKTAPVRHARR